MSLFSLTAFAERPPRLVDNAGLLSDWEAERVEAKLDEVSQRNSFDVVIVTVDGVGDSSVPDFADDFYDYNGYGMGEDYDGILLLISMEERDWYISTFGYGIYAFTDWGIDYIGEQIVDDLSSGWYENAFTGFAELCNTFIAGARAGQPYDSYNYKEPYSVFGSLVISLVVGLVVAFIAVSVMKGKLKGARLQSAASSYIKQGSLELEVCRDSFLYRNVIRTVRQSSSNGGGSNTHRSSSGRSHGGGGGKF